MTFNELLPKMISEMLSIPPRYTIVNTIDIENTIVAIVPELLFEAMEYYKRKYDRLPVFYLVADVKDITYNLKKLQQQYNLQIVTIYERRRLFNKQLCLYAQPSAYDAPTKFSLLFLLSRLYARGITDNFVIDAHVEYFLKLRYGELYGEKLSLTWFEEHLKDCVRIWSACQDDDSRRTFLAALVARLRGGCETLRKSAYPEYFHPVVKPEAGDIIVDGGLWDSMVIRKFAETAGPNGHVYGFEPLPSAFRRVTDQLAPPPPPKYYA
jgi:hypothetical protein